MIRLLALIALGWSAAWVAAGSSQGETVLPAAQAAIVKVYGLGGVAGLEGYQTGVFVETSGAVVTVDSTVLEAGVATLVDAYGDRYESRVVGRDATTGLALLACSDSVTPPGVLPVESPREARRAESVWALSNAFAIAHGDEPVTAQRARIAAIAPMPTDPGDRRTAVGAPLPGTPLLLLDAVTSNPGAGGGVVVSRGGDLLGVLGAERRSPLTGAWINYAVPAAAVKEAIARIRTGESASVATRPRRRALTRARLRELGVVLIPSVTRRTPPFVDRVVDQSPAGRAGLRPDDLIIAVGDTPVGLAETAAAAIVDRIRADQVELTLLRDQQVFTITLPRVAP